MRPRALNPTEVVSQLSRLSGWQLHGDGVDVRIEKTYTFDNYAAVMAFVNAVAFIAQDMDHHPDLSVHFRRCVVQYSTHDVAGLSALDFAAAQRVDAWLSALR